MNPAQILPMNTPVTALRGIAGARAAALERMGISTLYDLVHHFPRGYEPRGNVISLQNAVHGQVGSFVLCVATQPKVTMIRRGMVLLKFSAFDDSSTAQITFFNQPYLKDRFGVGARFRFYGKAEIKGHTVMLCSPKFEPIAPQGAEDGSELAPYVPVYPLTEGITQAFLSQAVDGALQLLYPKGVQDALPMALREQRKLCSGRYAMWTVHHPPTPEALEKAQNRIIYEELLLFALGLALKKEREIKQKALPCQKVDMTPFFAALPYRLTRAQKRAVDGIIADMTEKNSPMSRMLMGDVGSGKTVVAAAGAYFALKNGYQSALMAPTEILARQHYEKLCPQFDAFGYHTALLLGATKPKEKEQIRQGLERGEINFVIGTHALLQDNVRFASLGLVITDEQHRFGVLQRAALREKTAGVHTLVMSATPIPRTLALMLFGDLEMSVLDELPPGRQEIQTVVVDERYRTRLNGFLKKEALAGRQIYVVCPAIAPADVGEDAAEEENIVMRSAQTDENEKMAIKSAVEQAAYLKEELAGIQIGCLHGKMKSKEKEEIMAAFARGDISILVSTTVVEVGVDVPNATVMVIENADRFGLSQLHQLRGRVGRGAERSYCVLVSDTKEENARQRLNVMKTTADGFAVAQRDLELRGPGDFFTKGGLMGEKYRQSGGVNFRMANLCQDMSLIADAFAQAEKIVHCDPTLAEAHHANMKEQMLLQFGEIICM